MVIDKSKTYLVNFKGDPFERQDLIDEINSFLDKDGILVGEIFNYKQNRRTRSFDLVKNLKKQEFNN